MRRLFWMFLGAGLGLYGRHKAKKTVDRYIPPVVSEKVVSSVKTVVKDAVRAQAGARRYLAQRKDQNQSNSQHQ